MFTATYRNFFKVIFSVYFFSALTFFSPNTIAIVCVDEEECPAQVKKIKQFARYGSPSAQIMLSTLYSEGTIVKQNLNKSFSWLRKAAKYKPTINIAQHQLALAYLKGKGTKKDVPKSLRLFKKSASNQFSKSQLFLGILYFEGIETERDLSKAHHWFIQAANQKNPTAAFILGHMNENGFGVEENLIKAKQWFQIAAKKNHAKAIEKLKYFNQKNQAMSISSVKESHPEGVFASLENTLVITRNQMSKMDLMDLFIAQITSTNRYNRSTRTGSHIPGVICGEGAELCYGLTDEEEIIEYIFAITGMR